MGKIKRDHSGWHSSGLWLKYQSPSVQEASKPPKKKKNTRKWCKGKQGVEHVIQRRFRHYGWSTKRSKYIYTVCVVCRKEFHANNTSVPLKIEIDETNQSIVFPIQVKVNGKAVPIDYHLFENEYYCWQCKEWHSKY